MSNIDETYSKHRYEINIVECAYEVVQRMKAVKKRPKNQISVEEYAFQLREAIQAYKWSIDFDKSASEVARKRACVISPTHPAFDFWLALHLCIEETDEISMLLDSYFNSEFGKADNFLGHVQYFVLKIMKANVFFDFKAQKQEVINWVRKKRNAKKMQQIGLDDAKVVINENNIDQLLYAENFINQRIEIKSIQNNFNTFNTYHIHTSEKEFDANEQKSKAPNVLDVSETPQEDISQVELIYTTCTYEKAFEHFLQLTQHKNSKLSPTDIEYFLCSNFSFEGRQPMHPAKPLFIQIAQRHLNQLFYDFQLCFDYRASIHGYEAYYALLKRTFVKQYMETNFDSFKKNFSRKFRNYPFKSLR